MLSCELDYELPSELIASEPAEPRDAARLMVMRRNDNRIDHCHVRDLPDAANLRPGDVMVFNQTRVLPALFQAVRQDTGGRIQGLFLHQRDEGTSDLGVYWDVLLESRGKLRPGEHVQLTKGSYLELVESLGGGQWRAKLSSPLKTMELLGNIGSTPLPPYIRKQRRLQEQPETRPDDARRYNTVFATDPGSVAGPTAALHFTPELLQRIGERGVERVHLTLHIGQGTFTPVRTARVEQHRIHDEWMCVPADTCAAIRRARQLGTRIIPVGTTCVRALESLPDPLPERKDFITNTRLFIRPPDPGEQPFPFRFTDALMTNFHLPRSTLLALVAALPGVGLTKLNDRYKLAIAHRYRFYSYGDAMLVL